MNLKKYPKVQLFFFSCIFFLFIFHDAQSQCAMCKAVAETAQDQNSIAKGLNSGILYLLAFPIIVMSGIVIFFFRKQILLKMKFFFARR